MPTDSSNYVEADIPVVRDDSREVPVPTAWRPTFRRIVDAFVAGDYELSRGVVGVAPVPRDTATQIERYVADYGATLVPLAEETWDSSVSVRMGDRWNVLVDLWTEDEGRSDLVLEAFVSESPGGFVFEIHLVYVP